MLSAKTWQWRDVRWWSWPTVLVPLQLECWVESNGSSQHHQQLEASESTQRRMQFLAGACCIFATLNTLKIHVVKRLSRRVLLHHVSSQLFTLSNKQNNKWLHQNNRQPTNNRNCWLVRGGTSIAIASFLVEGTISDGYIHPLNRLRGNKLLLMGKPCCTTAPVPFCVGLDLGCIYETCCIHNVFISVYLYRCMSKYAAVYFIIFLCLQVYACMCVWTYTAPQMVKPKSSSQEHDEWEKQSVGRQSHLWKPVLPLFLYVYTISIYIYSYVIIYCTKYGYAFTVPCWIYIHMRRVIMYMRDVAPYPQSVFAAAAHRRTLCIFPLKTSARLCYSPTSP